MEVNYHGKKFYNIGPWAEFSSLDSAVFVPAMDWIHFVKQPNLKLKTQPKQLLGSLTLAFELPGSID
jgi:hypothetical protein